MKDHPPTLAAGALIAALGIALGLAVVLQPQALRVPAWIAYLAALALLLAGWTVIARGREHRLLKAWLPVALLACMTAIPVWLAFGPGPRRCGFSASRLFVRLLGSGSDLLCRAGFGLAAIVGMGLVLLAAWYAIRASRGD